MEIAALIISILAIISSIVVPYYLNKKFGDVAGTKLTIDFEQKREKEAQLKTEKGALASLKGELKRSRALCEHNANLRNESTATFIRFPTTVAMHITFEKRHDYPIFSALIDTFEAYTMGLLHINQLMDLHDMLWISPVPATGVDGGAQSRRENLRNQITDICAGNLKLKGVGPENFIILDSFIDFLLKSVEDLKIPGTVDSF